jgi:hypothetical protein
VQLTIRHHSAPFRSAGVVQIQPAAIHINGPAGDVAGFFASQKGEYIGVIRGLIP